jgi:hypothetical protein
MLISFVVTVVVILYVFGTCMGSDTNLMGTGINKNEEMKTHIMKLSQEGKIPAYWELKRNLWRPPQLRKKKHIAIAFMTNDMMRKDECEIRYFDGYKTIIGMDELSKGRIVPPTEVSKQWVRCRPGFFDLTNRKHE